MTNLEMIDFLDALRLIEQVIERNAHETEAWKAEAKALLKKYPCETHK